MRDRNTAAGLWMAIALAAAGCKTAPPTSSGAIAREPTRLYFGDTHVHSSYSADAHVLGNRSAGPRTAYRWAKGLPVVHPGTQARVQIVSPLDFLVVADHAELLGAGPLLMEIDSNLGATTTGQRWASMLRDDDRSLEAKRAAWADIVDAAEEYYTPCAFTTIIGWEWTAGSSGKTVPRVVLMSGGRDEARELLPLAGSDGDTPEALWDWLEETSERVDTDFIAIPHNPNLSGGAMFDEADSQGRPLTASYARMRMRWEPIAEVTQFKGDSETHPRLSPHDELADFERFPPPHEGGGAQAEIRDGDYLRSALKRGLSIQETTGVNPYKVGMIGSTDSHTGLASAEEHNFWGETAISATPSATFDEVAPGLLRGDVSASGLAAVWAEENTRTAIFAAFKRKEVYATTGPRIRLRFFGGWHFKEKNASKADMVQIGYTYGHPMGSDLTKAPQDESPKFLVYAVKDPRGANLDRIQIVKGWVDADGRAHENVYDVALAGRRGVDDRGRPEPIPSTVDVRIGKYENVFGAASLTAYWEDPKFDRSARAFYYVRVLQIPTPRHSLQDTVALKKNPDDMSRPAAIQERAYSSPIWYTP